MNYIEALKYIESTAKFGSNLGLTRTEKILEFLEYPHKELKAIHIAGTNGKGSTSAMINQILIEAGYKVGMYTSPYLEEFEERIQINNVNIPKDDLSEVVTKVSKAVSKVINLGFDHPTEFEIITCAMFLYFKLKKVDYVVLEVGLGGRLDSTNVITPILSVITPISFDHTNILGTTLKEIAYEKAGIIKNNIPVLVSNQEADAMDVIVLKAKEKNANLTIVKEPAKYLGQEDYCQLIRIDTLKESYSLKLSLLGKYQLVNSALAVFAAEILMDLGIKISTENIRSAFFKVKWKGRLEVLKRRPLVVIDGAHNPHGIKELKESIDTYFKYHKLILILGILKDKEMEEMIKTITKGADKVIALTPNSNRAESSKELEKLIKKYNKNTEAYNDYSEGFKKALSYGGENDLILVCGSLYMIGDMRKIIRNWV